MTKNKTKPAKRGEWGVWIPCGNKPDAEAKLDGICYHNHAFHGWAKVRRLPMLPATRKET